MSDQPRCTCATPPPASHASAHEHHCEVFRQWMKAMVPPREVNDPRVTRAPGRPDPRRAHGDRETE